MNPVVDELLARYVEQHYRTGAAPDPEVLCSENPELVADLRQAVRRFFELETTLRGQAGELETSAGPSSDPAPDIEGFRTIERIGGGGGGDVYKLEDLELGRIVAAKVLRGDRGLKATAADFLREARALALFDDSRIVRLFELRSELDPPVLLMEYIDGFELGDIGRSLEYSQRARIMAEVADAVDGAHRRGIVHRDLKPANILVDHQLKPRLLDFGLSADDNEGGFGRGTPAYMAPEQLVPGSGVVGRLADVYSLGVVLYELLCGALPFEGASTDELVRNILEAKAKLPMELDSSVPEPLQAIALKAMEHDRADRYQSAGELASDLRRFITGQPVLARPTLYQAALGQRVRPHLQHVKEWLRLKLIYPHEALNLQTAYRRLDNREDDWILHGRALSWSQITLYLGAFLLLCGSLFFFASYSLHAVEGVLRPLLTLGLPVVGLSFVGFVLLGRKRRAVAVAFLLAGALLLPLMLLILIREAGLFAVVPGSAGQLFEDAWISNRQLQLAFIVAALWSFRLALKTRTAALSVAWVVVLAALHLAVVADFGLRTWLEEGRWDLLATGLLPLLLFYLGIAICAERRGWDWLAGPVYHVSAGLLVVILELLALDGRLSELIGVTFSGIQPENVSSPLLLDTIIAMVFNGGLVYGVGWLMDRYGTALMRGPAAVLFVISPFLMLEPILYLNATAEYSVRLCWLYLAIALTITLLSHVRQRKSFYVAGLVNTGMALWQITSRNEWFDEPVWATMVLVVGLAVLVAGYALDREERTRRN